MLLALALGRSWLRQIFGRASGGPVKGGKPYIVGEEGAELFVPGVSGSIVNADDTREAAAEALGVMGAADTEDDEGATRRSTAQALGVMGAARNGREWR